MSPPRLTRRDGICLLSPDRPILATSTLEALGETMQRLALEETVAPVVLVSEHPSIFLAGAHLAEIAALDARTSHTYGLAGRAALEILAEYPAPVVAAVGGTCAGGGLDLVLACDAAVLGPDARLLHPGVKRGLVTGWGGTWRLPTTIGSAPSRKAFLEGTPIAHGNLDAVMVVTTADPVPSAVAEARRLAALHPTRLRWHRSLKRGRFIDRFRTSVIHLQGRY